MSKYFCVNCGVNFQYVFLFEYILQLDNIIRTQLFHIMYVGTYLKLRVLYIHAQYIGTIFNQVPIFLYYCLIQGKFFVQTLYTH